MAAKIMGEKSCIGVETATRRIADDDGHRLAFIEVLRLRVGAAGNACNCRHRNRGEP
jgi:hypothetical protein